MATIAPSSLSSVVSLWIFHLATIAPSSSQGLSSVVPLFDNHFLTAIAPSSSQGTIVGCVFMDFQFGCHPLLSSSLWSPSSPLLPSSSRSSPFVSIVVAVLAFVAIVVTVLPVVSHCRRSPHLRRDAVLTFVAIVCCTSLSRSTFL